jgi:hypothetical protein
MRIARSGADAEKAAADLLREPHDAGTSGFPSKDPLKLPKACLGSFDEEDPGRGGRKREIHPQLDSFLSLLEKPADRLPVFLQDFLRRIPEKAFRSLVQVGKKP